MLDEAVAEALPDKATALPVESDPCAHALVLLDLKQGDHLGAWLFALRLVRYTSRSDLKQRQYWIHVAEAIAERRPRPTEFQFLRGRQFLSRRAR